MPECRRHHLAGSRRIFGVFSEVCGHFYVAAGRWAAKQRLAELKGGLSVLNICVSCHRPLIPYCSLQNESFSVYPLFVTSAGVNQRGQCGVTEENRRAERYSDSLPGVPGWAAQLVARVARQRCAGQSGCIVPVDTALSLCAALQAVLWRCPSVARLSSAPWLRRRAQGCKWVAQPDRRSVLSSMRSPIPVGCVVCGVQNCVHMRSASNYTYSYE